MRRVTQSDSRLLDLVMPRLSRLANHGVLWTALAAGLWASGDRWARRAAWRWRALWPTSRARAWPPATGPASPFPSPGGCRGLPGQRRSRSATRHRRPPSPPGWRWRNRASRFPSPSSPPPWERPGWSPPRIIRPMSSPGSPSARRRAWRPCAGGRGGPRLRRLRSGRPGRRPRRRTAKASFSSSTDRRARCRLGWAPGCARNCPGPRSSNPTPRTISRSNCAGRRAPRGSSGGGRRRHRQHRLRRGP